MVEISENTLVMAIQAIADAVNDLRDECAETDGPELPDIQELLLSYSIAAGELKKIYAKLAETDVTLPEYAELIARRGS